MNMLRNNGPMQNAWLSKGAQAVSGAAWGCTQDIKHYFSLKKSNDSLAVENHALRLRIAEMEAENDLQGSRIQMPDDGVAGNFRYIPASIVKISNNTRHYSIYIIYNVTRACINNIYFWSILILLDFSSCHTTFF